MIRCLMPPAVVLAVLMITLMKFSCGHADTITLNDKTVYTDKIKDIQAAFQQKTDSGKPFRVLVLGESINKNLLFSMLSLEAPQHPLNTSIDDLVRYDVRPGHNCGTMEIFDSQIFDKANSFDQVRLKLLIVEILKHYEYIDCIFLVVSAKLSDDGTKKIYCPLPDVAMRNFVVVHNNDKRDDDLIRVEGKKGSAPAFQLFLKEPSNRAPSILLSVLDMIVSLPRIDAKKFTEDPMFSSILTAVGGFFRISKVKLGAAALMLLGWFWSRSLSMSSLLMRSEAPVPEDCEEEVPSGAASLSSFGALFVLLFPIFA